MSPPRRLTPRSRLQAGRPCRRGLIVRRVTDTRFPARPLRQIAITPSSPTAMGRRCERRPIIARPRQGRERHTRLQVRGYQDRWATCRRGASPPTAPGWTVQMMAHNLDRWTARIGLGERTVITKTLRRRVFALVGRITRSAQPPQEASRPGAGLGSGPSSGGALARLQAIPFPAMTASLQLTQRPRNLSATLGPGVPYAHPLAISASKTRIGP